MEPPLTANGLLCCRAIWRWVRIRVSRGRHAPPYGASSGGGAISPLGGGYADTRASLAGSIAVADGTPADCVVEGIDGLRNSRRVRPLLVGWVPCKGPECEGASAGLLDGWVVAGEDRLCAMDLAKPP